MFNIITQPTTIKDRHIITLTPIMERGIEFPDIGYTRFIVCTDTIETAKFKSQTLAVASVNGAFYTKGKGYVLGMPGLLLPDEKLCTFDPAVPGNLSYIDGCSNSNLIDPPRNGDPCLNYLYFPINIQQTFHTHPSVRIGFVVNGSGIADADDTATELTAGSIFILDRHTKHRFRTTSNPMSLVAFHPDSEDGPKDEFNPMKSRTYIR